MATQSIQGTNSFAQVNVPSAPSYSAPTATPSKVGTTPATPVNNPITPQDSSNPGGGTSGLKTQVSGVNNFAAPVPTNTISTSALDTGINPNTIGPKNSYSVLTSAPATASYNAIQQDYQNNIAPKLQQGSTNPAVTSTPQIAGYNVSATPTKAQGETTMVQNGQTYYVSPQSSTSEEDIKSMLSGGNSGGQPQGPTPSQTAQAQTGVNPTAEAANYQAGVSGVNDEMTSAYNTFRNTISSIMSGSFPLSQAQQSMVDATNMAFQQMNTQANLKAAALSSETGGVSNKINASAGELINITAQQSAAIANLELGFRDQNYKMVTDSYAAFKGLEDQKMTAITNMHNSVMDTYKSALAAATAQQTFNETVFKDAKQLAQSNIEFRDAHDQFGNVVGTEMYDKSTGQSLGRTGTSDGSTPASIPTVQFQPNGAPDPQSQQAFLQTIPSQFRQLVQNVANYQQNTSSLSPKTKTQIESWAAQYDPTYDSKQYTTRQALMTNFASGKYSQNKNSLNTAVGHLADLSSNFAKLGNRSIPGWNKIANSIESNLGAGGITSASTNIHASVGELASTFKGSGATDQEISNLGTIDTSSSPEQAKAFIETGIQLLASRLQALTDTYTQGMGKPPETNFLSPTNISQLSQLKNQGYKVDIPGINYTDPVAYVNASSENASELTAVRQQFPDLSPADALAQAQYNQSQGQ